MIRIVCANCFKNKKPSSCRVVASRHIHAQYTACVLVNNVADGHGGQHFDEIRCDAAIQTGETFCFDNLLKYTAHCVLAIFLHNRASFDHCVNEAKDKNNRLVKLDVLRCEHLSIAHNRIDSVQFHIRIFKLCDNYLELVIVFESMPTDTSTLVPTCSTHCRRPTEP